MADNILKSNAPALTRGMKNSATVLVLLVTKDIEKEAAQVLLAGNVRRKVR